jgi:hypothetical protein
MQLISYKRRFPADVIRQADWPPLLIAEKI